MKRPIPAIPILALILIAASTARPAERDGLRWNDFEKAYLHETVRILSILPSTQGYVEFLKRRGVDLKVLSSEEGITEHSNALYDPIGVRILINQDVPMEALAELRVKGRATREAAEILAWKHLSSVVHEIKHAMTRAALEKAVGGPFPLPVLEDEQSAFVEEICVFNEAAARKPDVWEKENILETDRNIALTLELKDMGLDVLFAKIAELYDRLSYVETLPRDVYLSRVDDSLARARAVLKDCEYREDEVCVTEQRDVVAKYERSMGVLRDRAKYRRLQKFYGQVLKNARARFERECRR